MKLDTDNKYAVAHAAGWDAGNRSARSNGREHWNETDFEAAAKAFNAIYGDLYGQLANDKKAK